MNNDQVTNLHKFTKVIFNKNVIMFNISLLKLIQIAVNGK